MTYISLKNRMGKVLLVMALLIITLCMWGCDKGNSSDEDTTTSTTTTQATDPTAKPIIGDSKDFKAAIEAYSNFYKSNLNNSKYSGRIVLDADGMPMMIIHEKNVENISYKITFYNYIDNKVTSIKELELKNAPYDYIYCYSDGIIGIPTVSDAQVTAIHLYQVKGDNFEQFGVYRVGSSIVDIWTLTFAIDSKNYSIPHTNLTDNNKADLELLYNKLYGSDYLVLDSTCGDANLDVLYADTFLNSPCLVNGAAKEAGYMPNNIFIDYLNTASSTNVVSQEDFLVFDTNYGSQVRINPTVKEYYGTNSWSLMYREPELLNKLTYKLYSPIEYASIIDISLSMGYYEVINYNFMCDLSGEVLEGDYTDSTTTVTMETICIPILLQYFAKTTDVDSFLNMTVLKNTDGETIKKLLTLDYMILEEYANYLWNDSIHKAYFDNFKKCYNYVEYKAREAYKDAIDATDYKTALTSYKEFQNGIYDQLSNWATEYSNNPDLDEIITYNNAAKMYLGSNDNAKYAFCSLGLSGDMYLLTNTNDEYAIIICGDATSSITANSPATLYICDNGRYVVKILPVDGSDALRYYTIYSLNSTSINATACYKVDSTKNEYYVSKDNSTYGVFTPCTEDEYKNGISKATEGGSLIDFDKYCDTMFNSIEQALDSYKYSD